MEGSNPQFTEVAEPPAANPMTPNPDPAVAVPTASSETAHYSNSASSLSPTRPPYIPQFTAATQMILKRMKGEPSSFGPALSSAATDSRSDIAPSTYEDVRRRLVMGMSTTTSMTMEMPAPVPPPDPSPAPLGPLPKARKPSAKAGMSAIRRISSGLSASGRSTVSKPTATKTASSSGKIKIPKATSGAKAGTKRKRGPKMEENGDDSSSSHSSLFDAVGDDGNPKEAETTPPPVPTMTKSGRQVQKPLTYNPVTADASSSKKRAQQSKTRTAEQALCKRCTRMHSPASNQMVFCDGCNDGWHQMCHDPWIEDDVVRDVGRAWFCADCQARRDRHFVKRQKAAASAGTARESWASRPLQEKRAYLSALPQQELVGLMMYVLHSHPDLPIFPNLEEPSVGSPLGEILPNGPPGAAARKVSGSGGPSPPSKGRGPTTTIGGQHKDQKGIAHAGTGQEQELEREDDEDFDPLAPPWPKPGKGLYSLLPPDEDDEEHLVDDDDYEAFSVIVYDENGKKIEENGIKV